MVRSLKGHPLTFTSNGMERRTGRGMTESEGQGYLPGLPNRAGNTETGGAASLPVSSLPCISLSPTFPYSFSDSLKELYHLPVYISGIFCDSLHLDKFLQLPSNLSDLEVSGPDTLLACGCLQYSATAVTPSWECSALLAPMGLLHYTFISCHFCLLPLNSLVCWLLKGSYCLPSHLIDFLLVGGGHLSPSCSPVIKEQTGILSHIPEALVFYLFLFLLEYFQSTSTPSTLKLPPPQTLTLGELTHPTQTSAKWLFQEICPTPLFGSVLFLHQLYHHF